MSGKRKITTLGAGSWGTALACVMARNGNVSNLWGRNTDTIEEINSLNRNSTYLGDIELERNISATSDLQQALDQSELILLVTPAQTIGDMGQNLSKQLGPTIPVILCSKGINSQSGKLPSQTLAEVLPNNPIAALSGPSFASDAAQNLPTAVTLASNDMELAKSLAQQLSGPAFRIYASDDITGVELGGALKNVIALAVGVCRGMGLGASAEAALITRGFAELSRLSKAMGAKSETLVGLSGFGDLVLSCSSPQSRNFSYGMALSQGKDLSDMKLAEGTFTASIAAKLALENNIECPIISTVDQLLEKKITPQAALTSLLSRPLKKESE